ncbi:hypothetical protein WMY93_013573 [Mugilogobius chulae]|uniref:Uncharacterized protein n=1 Tax=Mugilogobius chulae TaxID=88201 RepID=A0AAW0P4D6_9GOBI
MVHVGSVGLLKPKVIRWSTLDPSHLGPSVAARGGSQKPELTGAPHRVDTEWMLRSAGVETQVWSCVASRLQSKRDSHVRPAVHLQTSKRTTGLPLGVPFLRHQGQRGGKISPPAVRASDEEKRRAEGIG